MFNLLSFCSAGHGLCVYGFPVMWINFPKYWSECCSPSLFFSRNPLITDDHVVDEVPQNMGFDESNHILFMCIMKSMYYLTFLSNKQQIDIFMKNHPTRCHTLKTCFSHWILARIRSGYHKNLIILQAWSRSRVWAVSQSANPRTSCLWSAAQTSTRAPPPTPTLCLVRLRYGYTWPMTHLDPKESPWLPRPTVSTVKPLKWYLSRR